MTTLDLLKKRLENEQELSKEDMRGLLHEIGNLEQSIVLLRESLTTTDTQAQEYRRKFFAEKDRYDALLEKLDLFIKEQEAA